MRISFLLLFYLFLLSCGDGKITEIEITDNQFYKNHHDSVKYVGKETCKTCHVDIYNSYLETGMGKSFARASRIKSVLDENNNPLIYDTIKNLFYQPLWKKDSLFLMEFRIENKDTIHKIVKKIDFIIGSGHHTNSHIFSINGYLHQMPYTFYTQEGRADLPPGYEDGNNTRFSREIGMECISCHNAYPSHVEGSINKYHSVLEGIDCERCHGPGQIHVLEKMSGIIVDTSKYIDHSIVNPRKLSDELQFDVCRRCHLQGTTVLKNGKNWNDFKPGLKLSETMETYVPRYENDNSFIMASHVDRLQQSKCYDIGGVSCITCHNPHKSVSSLSEDYFNNKCLDCHNVCEDISSNNDCISCHMPKSSTSDIPHVTITDHNISVHKKEQIEKGDFVSLYCVNNPTPKPLSRAKAYLKHYESFDNNILLLDSAKRFLNECSIEESLPSLIKYYYLKNNYKKILKLNESYNLDDFHKTFTKSDLSLMYSRIADAYSYFQFYENSYLNYLNSLNFSPENIDYMLKTAVIEIKLSKFEDAKGRLYQIIENNPYHEKSYYNLGLIYMNVDKNYSKALTNFEIALSYNPDYELVKDKLLILNDLINDQ